MWWLIPCVLGVAQGDEPASEEASADTADVEIVESGFFAGSYGRANLGYDLQGGRGDALSVARRTTRHELGPYLELDLGWKWRTAQDAKFKAVITPALTGDVFHYSGEWNAQLAIRNLYVEAEDFIPNVPLTMWAGARMYRGDDIYLLDFWPMDNLNTYGGGLMVRPGAGEIALHVGANRLTGQDFQLQLQTVQVPDQVDGVEVVVLDRQRVVSSLRGLYHFDVGGLTLRTKLYGELHHLPEGVRQLQQGVGDPINQELPEDWGSLMGAQLSLWGWAEQSFVHLWARRASGLAAYGELAIPQGGLALDFSAAAAESWMVAAMANHETPRVGVMGALVAEWYHDADGIDLDFDDRFEFIGVVRPQVYIGRHLALGVEVSHQHVRPNGANPRTGRVDVADLTKVALLPAVQLRRGGYSRPRIQFVYQASVLDNAAMAYFAPQDQRVQGRVNHFMGIGAEWWVNSQRIITPTTTLR